MGKNMQKIVLAITGASGTIYAYQFAKILATLGCELHLIFSETGLQVAKYEIGTNKLHHLKKLAKATYNTKDFWSAPASGSGIFDAMVILPCTMGTLGAIANGISNNLIHRAADCFLKEQKPLIAAVRESPFNHIHIDNMLKLSRAGGTIFPAMPAFYTKPKDLDEMAFFFAGRIAQFLGFDVKGLPPWRPEPQKN